MESNSTPAFLGGKSRAIHLGAGADLLTGDVVREEDLFKSEDGNTYLMDRLNQKTFSSQATFENQYADQFKNRGSVKRTSLKARVFDLSIKEDLDAYNSLLESAVENNPKVEIQMREKQFWKGKFFIYVEYNDVLYKLPETK